MTERDILRNYATNRCDKQIVEVKYHLTDKALRGYYHP